MQNFGPILPLKGPGQVKKWVHFWGSFSVFIMIKAKIFLITFSILYVTSNLSGPQEVEQQMY